MWDLPGPGLEPMSPALAGGFLTAAPPGKPRLAFFLMLFLPLGSVSYQVPEDGGFIGGLWSRIAGLL